MKKFKIVLGTVICILLLGVIVFAIYGIVLGANIDTVSQEKVLSDYSKKFDIKNIDLNLNNDDISEVIEISKDGYNIKFKYKDTKLHEKYNDTNELIEKNYTNDIKETVMFCVFIIVFSGIAMFFIIAWMNNYWRKN